jgi:hypothetical protein
VPICLITWFFINCIWNMSTWSVYAFGILIYDIGIYASRTIYLDTSFHGLKQQRHDNVLVHCGWLFQMVMALSNGHYTSFAWVRFHQMCTLYLHFWVTWHEWIWNIERMHWIQKLISSINSRVGTCVQFSSQQYILISHYIPDLVSLIHTIEDIMIAGYHITPKLLRD